MSELEDIFAGLHAPAKGRGTDAPGRPDASAGKGGAARTKNAEGADGAATLSVTVYSGDEPPGPFTL